MSGHGPNLRGEVDRPGSAESNWEGYGAPDAVECVGCKRKVPSRSMRQGECVACSHSVDPVAGEGITGGGTSIGSGGGTGQMPASTPPSPW